MTTSKPGPEFEAVYKAAVERGQKRKQEEPFASSVRFNRESGAYAVRLTDGKAFEIPSSLIPELAVASPDQLANVDLFGEGEGLFWQDLDAAISIETLINRAFGETVRRIAARNAASAKSEAKAAASRANGSKGGRPKKAKEPEFVSAEPKR